MLIALGDYDSFNLSIALIDGTGKTLAIIIGKDEAHTRHRANLIARELSLSDNGEHDYPKVP